MEATSQKSIRAKKIIKKGSMTLIKWSTRLLRAVSRDSLIWRSDLSRQLVCSPRATIRIMKEGNALAFSMACESVNPSLMKVSTEMIAVERLPPFRVSRVICRASNISIPLLTLSEKT